MGLTLRMNDLDSENHRRLFIAVPLPESVKEDLKKNLSRLPGKKVIEDKWHFTLAFLGNVKETQLESLFQLFSEIPFPKSFEVVFTKLGAFPHSHSARVLWVGVDKGEEELDNLYQSFNIALEKAHFRTESRPFIPHLTISRFRHPENISKWIEKQPFHKVKFFAERVVLYQSIMNYGETRYEILLSRDL